MYLIFDHGKLYVNLEINNVTYCHTSNKSIEFKRVAMAQLWCLLKHT